MANQELVIIGRGISGTAAAALGEKLGYNCTIVTDDETDRLSPADLYVVSPGVPPLKSALYKQALQQPAELISEMEFGWRHWHRPVLAITGTNGKTTTTELTAALLQSCGVRAVTAGNIGTPLSQRAAEDGEAECAVAEVSNFQLERMFSFAPEAALLLNLASDHEDRYADGFAGYCAVKRRIFINVAPENAVYGLSFPQWPGRRFSADAGIIQENGIFFADLRSTDLAAPCNQENACGALELAYRYLTPRQRWQPEKLTAALAVFKRDRHRMEPVLERRGIKCVDDSKGTNPAATLAAIDGCSGPAVILLGGLGKGMDFSVLRTRARKLRLAVCFGRDRADLIRALDGAVPCRDCGNDFRLAVTTAAAAAQSGDTILLSPACASMDMFTDYKERGNRFAELIKEIL